jgi:hypothetical protein
MSGASRTRDERGIALAVALFALVVMAALVAGSFFVGRLEQQSGRNTLFASQAAEAAEAGLAEALTTLSSSILVALPLGGVPLDLGSTSFGAGFRVERQVSRLTSTVFLVRVLAARQDARGGDLAVRAIGSLLRLVPDSLGTAPRVAFLSQRSWVQLH